MELRGGYAETRSQTRERPRAARSPLLSLRALLCETARGGARGGLRCVAGAPARESDYSSTRHLNAHVWHRIYFVIAKMLMPSWSIEIDRYKLLHEWAVKDQSRSLR